jgi:carbon storage regulator
MLVLSRRTGEAIALPTNEVTITVLSVRGNRVQLGISAPAGMPIVRSELTGDFQADGGAECAQAARSPSR